MSEGDGEIISPHTCKVERAAERENLWTYSTTELWDLYYHHETEISDDYWHRIEDELAARDWAKR